MFPLPEDPQWANMVLHRGDGFQRAKDYYETELTKRQFINELLREFQV